MVNSVSFVDGKKLVVKKGTYLELHRVFDALCRERKGGSRLYCPEKLGEFLHFTSFVSCDKSLHILRHEHPHKFLGLFYINLEFHVVQNVDKTVTMELCDAS